MQVGLGSYVWRTSGWCVVVCNEEYPLELSLPTLKSGTTRQKTLYTRHFLNNTLQRSTTPSDKRVYLLHYTSQRTDVSLCYVAANVLKVVLVNACYRQIFILQANQKLLTATYRLISY